MTLSQRTLRRALPPLAIALAAVLAAGTLRAAPAEMTGSQQSRESTGSPSVGVGPAQVSLVAAQDSIPVGGTLGYTANVRHSGPIEYLQARMRLRYPATDRLIYQKTFIEQSLEPGVTSFEFERSLADIGLSPGVYPLELEVRVSSGGDIFDEVIASDLLIYDPEGASLPIALFARISAQPLSDPAGGFVSDPEQYTRARDDVSALANYVLSDPDVRFSLALSPLMLEEWQRIAGGYRFAGAEGEIQVSAEESTPRAYSAALENLGRAVGTGRLEVVSTGYSDPDLGELSTAQMIADVAAQYAYGSSACFAALGAQPSVGTAPVSGRIPQDAVQPLAEYGIGYAVARDEFTRVGDEPALPGRYRARESSLTVLVADGDQSDALAELTASELLPKTFEQYLSFEDGQPLPLLVTVGPGALEAQELMNAARTLGRQPWAELSSGSDAAAGQRRSRVRLLEHKPDPDAPADYWSTVRDSRRWSKALASALATGTPSVEDAERQSLISQGSAWAGVAGEWAPAWRGLAFANSALEISRGLLEDVRLDVKPVTLAGTSGQVPVTITSESDEVLELTLLQEPGRSVVLGSPTTRRVPVSPGENYLELPVELVNVLSGELRVSLHADDVELATDEVEIRASYLDRLALVGGVILLLAVLLVFIIVRVRSAQTVSPDAESDGQR